MALDSYSMKARAFPAILVMLPAALAVAVWFPDEWAGWGVGTGLLGATGLLALMTELARDAGKLREPGLFARWGGKPTTQILRHRDQAIDLVTKSRYHECLARMVPGIRLPTPAEEEADPALADRIYDSCTKFLIERTRDTKRFPLVLKELTSYGFRRNLWGMKPAGVLVAIIGLVAITARAFNLDGNIASPAALAAGLVVILLLAAWLVRVTPSWVRVVAFAYGQRLLASCDRIAAEGTNG